MKTYITDSRSQCQGKHPFPTFEIAASTISKKRDVALHPYKCGHCGFYHVGHVPSKKPQQFRKAKNVKRIESEAD